MALMTKKRVRHLPVLEEEAVVGVISIGDLVKSIIDDQRFTIDQLETYFRGESICIERKALGRTCCEAS